MAGTDDDVRFVEKTPVGFAPDRWLQGILIVLFVFLAYFPALRGGFIWDDELNNVVQNLPLRSLDGLRRIWFELGATQQYYPLTHTSFWIDYHLWGLNPLGYHVVNVLFQGINAVLLWLVLQRLRVPGAWLGAAIFALHPVHVESVAWITERKNMLSGFFFLASIWACLRFWLPERMQSNSGGSQSAPVTNTDHGAWKFYWLGLGLYLCALWSKTTTVALPVVVLLLIWWKRGGFARRDVCLLLPFLAVGVVMGLVTMWVEKHYLGAAGEKWGFSPVGRCLIAGRALWFYPGKLFWPHPLMFMYPRWTIDPSQWTAYLPIFAGVPGLAVLWWKRNGWARPVLCALGCYVVLLSPLAGFFNVYFFVFSFVCDHFQYLASISLLALAAAGISTALGRYAKTKPFLKPATEGVILLTLGALTWQQAHIYRDKETLWRDTVAQNPGSWMAHNHLGVCLLEKGQLSEAMECFRKDIQINPDDESAHNELGLALARCGKLDEAEAELRKAIQIKPDHNLPRDNYCAVLLQRGKLDEAEMEIHQVMLMAPNDPQSHYIYGWWLMLRGRLDEAEAEVSRVLQKAPDSIPPRLIQALIFRKRGQLNEAAQIYQSIRQLDPASELGRTGLADTLCALGKSEQAVACYRDILRTDPGNADVQVGLGRALIETGDLAGAESEFVRVLQVNPKNAKAIDGLGYALAMQGRLDEGRARFLESMQLDPKDACPHLHYALCLSAQRQARAALMEYRKAIELDDQLTIACNNLAWMLATHPDPQLRNGEEAVELAERACRLTNGEQPSYLNTLAAAYAEAGRFSDAIVTAEKARDLARKTGQENIARRNEQLLELFQAGRPFHEPADAN